MKGSVLGTSSPAETDEMAGTDGLVVASAPPGTNEATGRPAYCCPSDAAKDQSDDSAVPGTGAGGTARAKVPDEAAAFRAGARRRREGAPVWGFSS